jgi:hypothetical protein
MAVGLNGEDGACLDRVAVQKDGAGAAVGGVAPDVGAGETELVTEEVNEQQARLDLALVCTPVHGDVDGFEHVASFNVEYRNVDPTPG